MQFQDVQILNVKLAEDENGIIVRVVKTSNDKGKTVFTFPSQISSASEVDTLENRIKKLEHGSKSVSIKLVKNKITQFYLEYKR